MKKIESEVKKFIRDLGVKSYKFNNKTVFFKKDIVAALEVLGKDVRGTEPAEKDIVRLQDIKRKGGNDVNKIIQLVRNMAASIGRGSGAGSREKALRRAKAAEIVFQGEFGKILSNIFKESA